MEIKKLPTVTVITVSFNAAATIERTIRSILDQDYPAVDYVIVDGGSTDGTLDVIRLYENHLGRWISERDRGISDAFNKGVALAHGDFISFVNADDWLSPGQISAAMAAFSAFPEAAFVFGDLLCYENDKLAFRQVGHSNYRSSLRYRMDPLNHPSMVVRRALFDAVGGFRLDYKRAMDLDWLQRVDRANYVGIYDSRIVGNFSLGGISQRCARETMEEVRRCSIANYGRPFSSWAYYVYALTKRSLRTGLSQWTSPAFANRVREIVNPGFRNIRL